VLPKMLQLYKGLMGSQTLRMGMMQAKHHKKQGSRKTPHKQHHSSHQLLQVNRLLQHQRKQHHSSHLLPQVNRLLHHQHKQ
jgi:hypothetical protein